MIFCNTKGSTERVSHLLQLRGVDAQCIHGDIPQVKREKVMAKFRRGELRVFVATDVAARGIDVDDVDAVINYDVPDENEYYVHRIGRTGRAKRHGVAFTLVSDYPAWCAWRTSPSTPETTSSPSSLTSPAAWSPTTAEGGRETKRSTYPCRKSTAPSWPCCWPWPWS